MPVPAQDSKKALQCAEEFKLVCTDILSSMRSRGTQGESDMSVGAQLLRIVDTETGVTSIDHSIGTSLLPCYSMG